MSHLEQKAGRTVLSVEHFDSRFYGSRDGKPFATREYDVNTDEDCDRILRTTAQLGARRLQRMVPALPTRETAILQRRTSIAHRQDHAPLP